ncbi:MAG: stage II sporulation protein R [Lachnospiraceae bacterium]|nr:stage II sporulation protein R [Lachnospiraceae bacterium]
MNFHKNKWYFFLQKNSIFSVIFIFIGLISIAFAFTSTFIHLQKNSVYAAAQQELASHVVRFHVLAESDSKEDQELKLLVKTAVLEYMEQPLARADSADEALEILEQYTDDIIRVASDTLAEQGSYLSVKAGTERVYFPEKTYGDLTFPAGYYTAYRILLGSGEGQNWWCVLYPPLCFIDVTHSIVPEESKEEIKSFLSEEEYALLIAEDNNFALSDTDSNSQNTIEIRSRLFDWLTSLAP